MGIGQVDADKEFLQMASGRNLLMSVDDFNALSSIPIQEVILRKLCDAAARGSDTTLYLDDNFRAKDHA